MLIGLKVPAAIALNRGSLVWAVLMGVLAVQALRSLAPRIKGRGGPRSAKARSSKEPWDSWGTAAFLFNIMSQKGFEPSRMLWLGAAVALAYLGWWLEKTGRKQVAAK